MNRTETATASSAAQDASRRDAFRLGALPGQAWQISDTLVSTVVPTPLPRSARVSARPRDVEIDLARTALVAIDMQNDFVHADGWFAAKGIDVAPLSAPVPTIRALADAAREADLPVVWLNWGVAPGAPNLPANALFRGKRTADAIGYAEGAPGALVAGTWGAATIDALAPQAGDIYVSKQRFSGFPDAPLDSVLRNLGVTTLLFVGVNIDRCVFATLMDASARGYVCLLVEDACATVSPPEIAATIVWLTAELHGFVCQAAAVQSALASPPPTERG